MADSGSPQHPRQLSVSDTSHTSDGAEVAAYGRRGLPDLVRLRLLVELHRLGTMAEVAAATGYGTSAVSKHLSVLEQEVGARLLAPIGRRVQLTPAGERLVEHAVAILAAVEEARAELRGEREPVGRVRVASFVTAVDSILLPALRRLQERHPGVRPEVHEHEPEQAVELLRSGGIDLALIYDYDLVPRAVPQDLSVRHFEQQPLYLVVPTGAPTVPTSGADAGTGPRASADACAGTGADAGTDADAGTGAHASAGAGTGTDTGAPADGRPAPFSALRAYAEAGWIANSRGSDDDELVRRVCALAGFQPRIAHRVDSLRLVNSLVGAGLGVALVTANGRELARGDVTYRPLDPQAGSRRSFLMVRAGQWSWPPIAALTAEITRDADHVGV